MWRRLVLVPAVLAVALGALVGVEIAHPAVPADRPSALEREQIAGRARWNLTTDLRTIRAIDASYGQAYTGFPISRSERLQLRSQIRIGRHIPDVSGLVDKRDGFGGIWSDNHGDGAIAIGWVGAVPPDVRASVKAALPKGTPVHYVAQKFTHAELMKVFGEMSAVMSRGSSPVGSKAPTIYVVTLLDPVNRVEVTVASEADVTALSRRFGHRGVVVAVGKQPLALNGSAP